MKIQYASDLHLEFADNWRFLKVNPLQVSGDILVLAGDIGYLGDDNYAKHPFWDWASDNYKHVIVCMGNHEFYKYYDIATLPDGYILPIRHNVHSYYNAVVPIGDAEFIVTTLWSKIPLRESYYTEQVVSDFRRILYNGELLTFSDFILSHNIDYWIYGHSHYNIDAQIGKTLCLSNQLGYVSHNEHLTFSSSKYIKV